jgi:hypothetical protein
MSYAGASDAGQVTLAWDPTGQPQLGGYKLYYGTASRQYTSHIDVGPNTSYTVVGLPDGSTYYFAVTAYDLSRSVESGFSNEVAGTAGPDDPQSVIVHLEEPAPGSVYSGVSNLRGWALAPLAVDHVEVAVDGAFFANLPAGGWRPDVAAVYPDYPGSVQSGFSMAFNYSALPPGAHTVTVRAVTQSGGFNDASASFETTGFPDPFISDPAAVSLAGASLSHDSSTLYIDHLDVQGAPYNLSLQWRTATQGFAILGIAPAPAP